MSYIVNAVLGSDRQVHTCYTMESATALISSLAAMGYVATLRVVGKG